MNKLVVAGNWKMNKSFEEAKKFLEELKTKKIENKDVTMQIFAPSIYLLELSKIAEGTNIQIGCQNIHQEISGAFTGEVSASMLKSIGVNHTLVGHSERRQYYNETDEIVNQKTKIALENDINPVICVGETLDERNTNITNNVLKDQTKKALKDVSADDLSKVIIAYEPVWAIGTGKTATAEDANLACAYIRSVVADLYNEELANNLVIQYGGSVNPANAQEILGQSDINGALVGGASLELDSYLELLK